MKRFSQNIIKDLDKNTLQQMLNTSNTLAEVIIKIGLSLHGENYKLLQEKIKQDNLSLIKLKENKKSNSTGGVSLIDLNDVLVKNSLYSRSSLKRRLIQENSLEYKCFICSNTGEWNGQKLTLELDHINGINTDNRLENLRFLCPNCHSQTDTYKGKNVKRIKVQNKCINCNCDIRRTSTRCNKCAGLNLLKFEVTKEELQNLINVYPMTKIGKMFGVSDNAVKKRCITYGITKSH